jgi:hypothetical protein
MKVYLLMIFALIWAVNGQCPSEIYQYMPFAGYHLTTCGYIPRPLSSGKTINVFYVCAGNITTANKQAWMLQGGPGGNSLAMLDFIDTFASLDNKGYYCTTDYRGVGYSEELTCSSMIRDGSSCQITSNISTCIAEVQSKYNFSDFYTTQAANDVIALITMNNQINPALTTIIYGVSYGTFWVERIMQINNNIAQRWIFDGVVLPPWLPQGGWQYGALHADLLIKNFLKSCILDPTCGQHFTASDYINFELRMQSYNSYYDYEDVHKQDIGRQISQVFISPGIFSGSNFVEVINIINLIIKSTGIKKRDIHCSIDPIVYYIVKANELYTNAGISSDYQNFLYSYQQALIDVGTPDIFETLPWILPGAPFINTDPIITNGQVMVMGSNYDIQTAFGNSRQLFNYFQVYEVDVVLVEGTNWNHGTIGFTTPSGHFCGQDIVYNFIAGHAYDTSCLTQSEYATFQSAVYYDYTYPTSTPTAVATASPTPSATQIYIFFITDNAALGVVTALLIVAIIVLIVIAIDYSRNRCRNKRSRNTTDLVELVHNSSAVA